MLVGALLNLSAIAAELERSRPSELVLVCAGTFAEFALEDALALVRLETGPLAHPENFFAVIAKGDEVLDWREMTARYDAGPLRPHSHPRLWRHLPHLRHAERHYTWCVNMICP